MADTRVSLTELQPLVAEASSRFGVPEERIWKVIRAENSGSPEGAKSLTSASSTAISPKNARGIMQITPIALQDVQQSGLIPPGVSHENMSVRDQILTGTAYLSKLQALSDKDDEIFAMYNYGPKARFRMDALPSETQGYLQKTGSTVSASRPQQGPMMDTNALVAALLQTAQMQNQAMQVGSQQITGMQDRAAGMTASAIDQERAAVAEQAAIAGEKIGAQYSANKMLEQLQTMFRMDPTQVDNEIATNLAIVDTAKKARAPIRAEYDKAASVGLLDDPLGYIFAQLQLPKLAAQNNALADREEEAIQTIQNRTALLANAKSTIVANTADQLRGAALKQAAVDAKIAGAKLTLEEAKNVSAVAANKLQQINIANAMGDNTRQTLLGIASLFSQEEQRTAIAEQRAIVNEAKEDAAAQEARMDSRFKLISDSLGQPEPMTQKRARALMSKRESERWAENALNATYGSNLADSLSFFQSNKNPVGLEAQGNASSIKLADNLERAGAAYQQEAARASALTGKKLNANEARAVGYELYRDEIINSMSSPREENKSLSDSTWDTRFNPYVGQWAGFNKTLAADPKYAQLKGNLVAAAVENLIAAGVVKGENLSADQRKQAVVSVFKKVAAREVTPKKAAADIAAYFQALATYNVETNKYTLFTLPVQSSYVFTVPGDIGIGDKRVDLMDPKGVEDAVVWSAKQKPFTQIQEVLKMLLVTPNMLMLPGQVGRTLLNQNKKDQ